jgi:hypothetical protein
MKRLAEPLLADPDDIFQRVGRQTVLFGIRAAQDNRRQFFRLRRLEPGRAPSGRAMNYGMEAACNAGIHTCLACLLFQH